MKKMLGLMLLFCAQLAFGQVEERANIAEKMAATITADELRSILTVLAADDMQGRETATEGQKLAEAYLVERIRKLGIAPIKREGVTDGYLQIMPFTREEWGEEVRISSGSKEFQHLRDFYCFRNANDNLPAFETDEILFLGYGIDDEKYSDYKGATVAGKVVMILSGEPTNAAGVSYLTGSEKSSTWSSSWKRKIETATANGVKALLIIDPKAGDNIGRYRRYLVEPSLTVGAAGTEKEVANSFYISPDVATVLLGKKGKQLKKAIKSIAKSGKPQQFLVKTNVKLQQQKIMETVYSSNVMAFIEGSDEELKKEIVVITAHYDHLGKRGEEVYNGADDNGSGSTALLEIAEAYATAAKIGAGPRRSVLMMWVSGEEKGLLGSEYYVKNPIFPLENTIVDVNVDMIGRVDEKHIENPKYIYVIGSDRLSSELHQINEEMNERYTQIELDYTYNAEDDPNRYYYRSDHYNFAEKGIPAIFYFSGVHEDYHKITDTVEKIQFEKMETIARLVFHTSWELANRDERIVVDKK